MDPRQLEGIRQAMAQQQGGAGLIGGPPQGAMQTLPQRMQGQPPPQNAMQPMPMQLGDYGNPGTKDPAVLQALMQRMMMQQGGGR